jgi:hypothetical protein
VTTRLLGSILLLALFGLVAMIGVWRLLARIYGWDELHALRAENERLVDTCDDPGCSVCVDDGPGTGG